MTIVGDSYGAQRARAIGYLASVLPFGAVLGPTVGGLIVDHFGWRWTFGFNLSVGFAACVISIALLPRGAPRRTGAGPAGHRPDRARRHRGRVRAH
ncbi:MAG: MFS transporter [Dehalococcoidia bacterium]|nr:MFS transporter [Dehalococcoidia bacterium]